MHFCVVKILARKSGCVKFLTNIMSASQCFFLESTLKFDANNQTSFDHPLIAFCIPMTLVILAAVMYNA